jgi:hypothetical protein
VTGFLVIVDGVPTRVFFSRDRAEAFLAPIGPGACILPVPCEGE